MCISSRYEHREITQRSMSVWFQYSLISYRKKIILLTIIQATVVCITSYLSNMMVNVMFIFSFAFRINIQITISLNRCANFVDMIRWSRNLKDCTFSHHTSTSAASLTHWTCDWYTYNFCCQHMVCDKPHSPVLHPCESDSINFRETQLKFF